MVGTMVVQRAAKMAVEMVVSRAAMMVVRTVGPSEQLKAD